MNMKERFTYVYDNNVWGGSGGGSDPAYLGEYFKWLNQFIKEKKVKTVTDFGCGLDGGMGINCESYFGVDVVKSVIEHCINNYIGPTRKYYCFPMNPMQIKALSDAELVVIKDVFIHWSYDEIEYFMKFAVKLFKYIVLVNSCQQTEDYQKCSATPHLYATPLSYKYKPLSNYNPELIMTLNANQNDPKEVLLITNNNL